MNDRNLQPRLASIDLLRGAVMLLMAIDHVRVFAGVPAGGATAGLFFTRWVTHFCAPVFVLLAGTSAYLYGRRHADLSRFLLLRGAWLILLELTFLRVAWTFNFDFSRYLLAGVIWVIGWSLVALAGISRLGVGASAGIGALLVFGHNLMDGRMESLVAAAEGDRLGWIWKFVYVGFFAGPIRFAGEGSSLWVLYSLVPWIGVMALGYAIGPLLAGEPARRDRLCLAIGLGATVLFLLLRLFGLYGDPRSWAQLASGEHALPSLFAFLNTSKYPASLQFLLMTLGPAVALVPLLEKARGRLADPIALFGRVPFFYYLLHIPLIHLLAVGVSRWRLGEVSPWLFADHPMGAPPAPEGYAWSLPLLYSVWAIAVVLLYFACRWFAVLKARSGEPGLGWLRFL